MHCWNKLPDIASLVLNTQVEGVFSEPGVLVHCVCVCIVTSSFSSHKPFMNNAASFKKHKHSGNINWIGKGALLGLKSELIRLFVSPTAVHGVNIPVGYTLYINVSSWNTQRKTHLIWVTVTNTSPELAPAHWGYSGSRCFAFTCRRSASCLCQMNTEGTWISSNFKTSETDFRYKNREEKYIG